VRTVLVVDDDDDLVEAIGVVLRRTGCPFASARNGAEALLWLRSAPASTVCLILLDLMMPVMDGWQFRTEQLQTPELAHIPVVVLSGRVDVVKDGASVKAADYVRKPIDVDTLIQLVRRFCGPEATRKSVLSGSPG
jgi:CheY-like chemotaxis protein